CRLSADPAVVTAPVGSSALLSFRITANGAQGPGQDLGHGACEVGRATWYKTRGNERLASYDASTFVWLLSDSAKGSPPISYSWLRGDASSGGILKATGVHTETWILHDAWHRDAFACEVSNNVGGTNTTMERSDVVTVMAAAPVLTKAAGQIPYCEPLQQAVDGHLINTKIFLLS
ncbi:unnamed protein product, partial [Lampetra fluviatilis]